MGEAGREAGTLECPKCKRPLPSRDESYAYVYVCEGCGVIVLDLKFKLGKKEVI